MVPVVDPHDLRTEKASLSFPDLLGSHKPFTDRLDQECDASRKQNKKNRANSPGSQTDSGGRRVKSDFDEFMSAFN